MSPGNGNAAAATWAGDTAERVAGIRGWALQRSATLFVFAAALAVASVRVLAWPSALRQDQWVYTITGQALAHLERPTAVAQHTTTTPKPLTSLLALVVSPLPPERGFAAVSIVATAVLVAAAFAYGRRAGGPLGGVIAVAALALVPSLPAAVYGGEIDVITAALLVVALVCGRRTRVALMIVLGLLRPLAWPLAGVAAFLAAGGSLARRLALGVLAMAAPVVIWLATDAALYGSPLASYRANERINSRVGHEALLGALGRLVRGVWAGVGPPLFVVGLLGLAVAASRRPWRRDPFPACVLVGYAAALAFTWTRMPYNERYALPVVAFWPLAAAHLGSSVGLSRRLRAGAMPAAVCAVVVLAAAAWHMSMDPYGQRRAQLTGQMLRSVPAVERALACGPVGVRRPYSAVELVAATHHSIHDFRFWPGVLQGAPSEVLQAHLPALRHRVRALTRSGWRSQAIPLGRLWSAPRCQGP